MMQTIAIGLVITAELMNTAIEYLTDLVSPEKNDIAGKVKDIAAGAVTNFGNCCVSVRIDHLPSYYFQFLLKRF